MEPSHVVSAGLARRVGVGRTTGWLLRANRLLSRDAKARLGSHFARAFHGGSWVAGPISESRISRWESGATPVTYAAVRRYEELLRLTPNALVAPLDLLWRYARFRTLERPGPARLEPLLDRANAAVTMNAADWDELTAAMNATPGLVLVPSATWSVLTNRLVTEMNMSHGLGWLQRHEALNRLLNHPSGAAPAVDTCAALARDGGTQVFIETVCALEGTRHPDAAGHVLAQLRTPTNERARYGALLAALHKLGGKHFTDEQTAVLGRHVRQILGDPELAGVAGQLALRLRMPHPRAAARAAGPPYRHASDRIAASAAIAVQGDGPPWSDDILPVLVGDILADPSPDVRLYTAVLLCATPYRAGLARALAVEIGRGRPVPDRAEIILDALRVLGGPEQRSVVERLTVLLAAPVGVRVSAAYALGPLGSSGKVASAEPKVTEALIYAAGVSGDDAWLRRLAHHGAPAPLQRAADWWRRCPAHIRRSIAG